MYNSMNCSELTPALYISEINRPTGGVFGSKVVGSYVVGSDVVGSDVVIGINSSPTVITDRRPFIIAIEIIIQLAGY